MYFDTRIFFEGQLARVRTFDKPIGPGELAQIIGYDREHKSEPQAAAATFEPFKAATSTKRSLS